MHVCKGKHIFKKRKVVPVQDNCCRDILSQPFQIPDSCLCLDKAVFHSCHVIVQVCRMPLYMDIKYVYSGGYQLFAEVTVIEHSPVSLYLYFFEALFFCIRDQLKDVLSYCRLAAGEDDICGTFFFAVLYLIYDFCCCSALDVLIFLIQAEDAVVVAGKTQKNF